MVDIPRRKAELSCCSCCDNLGLRINTAVSATSLDSRLALRDKLLRVLGD